MSGEPAHRTFADLPWDTWLAVGILLSGALAMAIWKIRDMRRERRQYQAAEQMRQRYAKERSGKSERHPWVWRVAGWDEDYGDDSPTVPIARPYVQDSVETGVIGKVEEPDFNA